MTSHYPGYAEETKGPKILAVFWVMTVLTLLIVISRLYIRAGVLRNMGADDWLIIASMVMSLAYASVTSANVVLGYGRHTDTLSPERQMKVSLVNYIDFTLGIVSFSLPKLAVAALLSRIVNPNWFQRAMLWFLTGLVALASSICIIVLFTMCDPPRALWDVSLVMQGSAKCRDVQILIDYAIFTGAISAFTDFYLAVYPAVVLMKLNMSSRKKIALCLALGLGSVACAMAIVKCFQLPGLSNKTDPTYATAELVIWTCIESNVVIIASCIPTLHPLLEIILGRRTLRSWSASRDNYYKKGSGSNPLGSNTFIRGKRLNGTRKGESLTATHVGSQESILQADGNNTTTDGYGHPLGEIRRTDDVLVEYEPKRDPGAGMRGDTRGSW